jgi:hypothetical protein
MGVALFLSYVAFAYLVTHNGNFYHVRRWKAALWITNILGVILLVFFLIVSLSTATSVLPKKSV